MKNYFIVSYSLVVCLMVGLFIALLTGGNRRVTFGWNILFACIMVNALISMILLITSEHTKNKGVIKK